MKRISLSFSILVASTLFVLFACNRKSNTVPEQDTEVQSAVDASYMNYVVSDIETIISFMGENRYYDNFYAEYPGSSAGGVGTVTAIRDTSAGSLRGWLRVSFNKTRCKDGRLRHGSIFLAYVVDSANPNAKYMHSYKFQGAVTFSEFQVDSFNINLDTANGGYMKIANTLPTATYSPKQTNLTWSIDGKLKFTHLYDPKKNMIWEGHWKKTLANTSSSVVVTGTNAPINWYKAEVNYTGTSMGKVPVYSADGSVMPMVPFDMKFNPEYPLTRDFTCSADPIGGVTYSTGASSTGTMVAVKSEHHPFIAGVATFSIGSGYPREIYYGNEGQKATLPTRQCDNSGEVLIKGISYKVDFRK